jgi:glyoxylase-like metal-dependent hydrolase (beta-lactamase superfamily II)
VLHDKDIEILPGVTLRGLPGHTVGHQGVFFDIDGARALYTVDLVPTVAHLPLPYIMGFDTHPLTTLETKRAILRDATREGWLFLLEHDPDHLVVRVAGPPERPTFEKVA